MISAASKRVTRSLRLSRSRTAATLAGKIDQYNGVEVTEDLAQLEPETFRRRLSCSLQQWKSDERRGVWLRLPIAQANLVPIATEAGFWYHHATAEYLLLCNWLPGGQTASRLPPGASHYVGVAGFVLNSRRQLLVIQEKSGPAAGRSLWKIPGGLCDQGEDIADASIREVKEETGIDTEFVRLAAIVEGHQGRGPSRESASDLYCVSVLRVLDENQPIVMQEAEIEKCAWVDVDRVMSHPLYREHSAFGESYRAALRVADGGCTSGLTSEKLPVFGSRTATLLHVGTKSKL